MQPLQPHATWNILDSTKLKTFMSCPRRYFWAYVAGWRPEGESIDLVFGAAWHIAMEHMLLEFQKTGRYDNAAIPTALDLFTSYYRQYFTKDQDALMEPKNPSYALEALAMYTQRYETDRFKVIATEIAGTVPIADGRRIHFKIDALCQDKQGKLFVLEHKTSSRLAATWAEEWTLSVQVSTYIHALMCLQDPNQVYGARVNGAFFRKKGIEFMRVPVKKGPLDMQMWLNMVNHYADMIDEEYKRLLSSDEDNPILDAFPMNTESCIRYGVCPYHDFCVAKHNPLHIASQEPQVGFRLEYWDPMAEYKKTAKKIVRIGEVDKTDN